MLCYFCHENIEGDTLVGCLDTIDVSFHPGCWDILGNGKKLSEAIDLTEGKSNELAVEKD